MPGVKQRLAAASAASSSDQSHSALASLCLEKWAWGEMSAPMVQSICEAAMADGVTHPEVKELAKFTTIKHLQDKVPHHAFTNAITTTKMFMQVPGSNVQGTWQHMLLPHEMFSAMYHWDKGMFIEKLCGGSVDEISKFWNQMINHPAYPNHPARLRPGFREKCIPLSLHGDGVAVTGISKKWAKSCDAFSWRSVLARGSVVSTNFLIWLMFWMLIVKGAGNNMWDRFVKKLSWSFYWLFIGKFPDRDDNDKLYDRESYEGRKAGTDLAGGFYGCLWLLLGDLEYLAKSWGLANPGALNPCSLCRANKSDLPWTDARATASWRASTWTADSWVAGRTIHAYVPDIMHTLHLGAYSYLLGSILKHLVMHHMGGL